MDPLYGGIVSCSILHYLLLKMLLFKIHSISSRLTSQHISQSKSAVLLTSLVQERAFSFVGPAAGNQGPTSQKFSSQIQATTPVRPPGTLCHLTYMTLLTLTYSRNDLKLFCLIVRTDLLLLYVAPGRFVERRLTNLSLYCICIYLYLRFFPKKNLGQFLILKSSQENLMKNQENTQASHEAVLSKSHN